MIINHLIPIPFRGRMGGLPPFFAELGVAWWPSVSDGDELDEKSENELNATTEDVVGYSVGTTTGLIDGLEGTETIVSYEGTATATLVSKTLSIIDGSIYTLELSNGSKYSFSEGGGSIFYDSVNGLHGVWGASNYLLYFDGTSGTTFTELVNGDNATLDTTTLSEDSIIEFQADDNLDARSYVGNAFGKPELYAEAFYDVWAIKVGGTDYNKIPANLLKNDNLMALSLNRNGIVFDPRMLSKLFESSEIAVFDSEIGNKDDVYDTFSVDKSFLDISKKDGVKFYADFKDARLLYNTVGDNCEDGSVVDMIVNPSTGTGVVPFGTQSNYSADGHLVNVLNGYDIGADMVGIDPYLEFEVKFDSTGGYEMLASKALSGSNLDWAFIRTNTGTLGLTIRNGNTTSYVVTTAIVPDETWVKIQAYYDRVEGEGVVRTIIDGIETESTLTSIPAITWGNSNTDVSWMTYLPVSNLNFIGQLRSTAIGDASKLKRQSVYDGIFLNAVEYATGERNAQAEWAFNYSGNYLGINVNPAIYSSFAAFSQICVLVNGELYHTFTPSDTTTNSIILPDGYKEVRLIEGLISNPPSGLIGTWITDVIVDPLHFQKIEETLVGEKIVFLGDSITVGGNADVSATESFPRLFDMNDNKSVGVLGYGYGELQDFASDSTKLADTIADFTSLFSNVTSTKKICIALGTNDFSLSSTPASTFIGWYEDLLDAINAYDSTIEVYCLSPLVKTSDGALLDQYRSDISDLCDTKSFATHIAGKPILTEGGSDFDDSTHPSTAGHLKVYNAIQPIILS